jgi:hypothetical protein
MSHYDDVDVTLAAKHKSKKYVAVNRQKNGEKIKYQQQRQTIAMKYLNLT